MAGQMATWGPQSSTADECSLTCGSIIEPVRWTMMSAVRSQQQGLLKESTHSGRNPCVLYLRNLQQGSLCMYLDDDERRRAGLLRRQRILKGRGGGRGEGLSTSTYRSSRSRSSSSSSSSSGVPGCESPWNHRPQPQPHSSSFSPHNSTPRLRRERAVRAAAVHTHLSGRRSTGHRSSL